jgi:hypothetical protein
MARSNAAVLIPGTGRIYLAPVGTTAPADPDTAPIAPWGDVGHTSRENGVTITREGGDSEVKGTWQNPNLRERRNPVTWALTFQLHQVDADSLRLYFGGGVATTGKFVVPANPVPQEHVDPAKLPVPPMTDKAASYASGTGQVAEVIRAYYMPTQRADVPTDRGPGLLERRQHGRCSLFVFTNSGMVVGVRFMSEQDMEQGDASPLLADAPTPIRNHRGRRGGQGNRWPTTWAELKRRAQERGCDVQQGKTHMRVTLPGGGLYTMPCTAPDWRSLRNATLQLRARGVDVST